MKLTFRILLIVLTLTMLALRIRTVGWFLIIFGLIVLTVVVAQIVICLLFINKMDTHRFGDLLIFGLALIFFTGFFLFQADFGDTPESEHIVLQYVIGKNDFTEYCKQNWFMLSTPFGVGLLVMYVVMLIRYFRH